MSENSNSKRLSEVQITYKNEDGSYGKIVIDTDIASVMKFTVDSGVNQFIGAPGIIGYSTNPDKFELMGFVKHHVEFDKNGN